jgi:hypothetical protein
MARYIREVYRFLLKQCAGIASFKVARVKVGGARGGLAGRRLFLMPSAKGFFEKSSG